MNSEKLNYLSYTLVVFSDIFDVYLFETTNKHSRNIFESMLSLDLGCTKQVLKISSTNSLINIYGFTTVLAVVLIQNSCYSHRLKRIEL